MGFGFHSIYMEHRTGKAMTHDTGPHIDIGTKMRNLFSIIPAFFTLAMLTIKNCCSATYRKQQITNQRFLDPSLLFFSSESFKSQK